MLKSDRILELLEEISKKVKDEIAKDSCTFESNVGWLFEATLENTLKALVSLLR